MERLKIEDFPKSTHQQQTILTSELDDFSREWEGLPYKPLFKCRGCKEAGFVHPHKLDGSVDYKQIIPCNQPGCLADSFRTYQRGEIIQQSGMIGLKQTFETFNAEIPGVKKAYKAAWKIAEGDGDFIWLIIYGGVGNGKTHLLKAIANRVMERGISVKLIMVAELLSELRMSIETNQTDFKMKVLKEVPYLLIDELGLEYGTDWEKEKIEELLASRWANGRFTVVVTNQNVEDLPIRLKSRFLDRHLSRAVLNEAGDYRVKGGK